MTKSVSTRLKFISAKNPVDLSDFVLSLPFKIEIKGNPVQAKDGRWYLWFNLPENENIELPNGPID